MSAEFLHEIDETLRKERMEDLWKRYRFVLFGALIALFGGLAAYEWYQAHTAEQKQAAATTYWSAVKATEDNTTAEIEKIIAATETDHPGYRALADLRLGSLYIAAGEQDKALAAYQSVMDDSAANPALRDFATLMAAQLMMTTEREKAEGMLSTLRTNNSPFMYSAMEFQAMLAEDTNNKAAALNLYKQLMENETALPAGIRDRAQLRIAALEAERNSN